jgi:sugar lactone lactonase YvrE
MRTDGTPVQKITAPPEAGFKAPNEWRITAAVPGPDGSIFIANGYGDSRVFRFDKAGNYRGFFGGKGTVTADTIGDQQALFDCSHGLAVDTRYSQPLLLVCDRENRRLCHFDFDGKFVRTLTRHLRRPCQASFYGDYAVLSELEGRVTILDKDNVPVAFLGDNPQKTQWANYTVPPEQIPTAIFSAAHGAHIDRSGTIYISDWNQTGRITRLTRAANATV